MIKGLTLGKKGLILISKVVAAVLGIAKKGPIAKISALLLIFPNTVEKLGYLNQRTWQIKQNQ